MEIDGIAHDMGDRLERDAERTATLEDLGWRIERIAARAVLDDPHTIAEAVLSLARRIERN